MQPACVVPQGMADERIPDSSITASTFFSENPALHGRLNGGSYWASTIIHPQQWIQVDLGARRHVTGIMLQGSGSLMYPQWMTAYKIEYSDDGASWQIVKDDNQQGDMVRIIYKIEKKNANNKNSKEKSIK